MNKKLKIDLGAYDRRTPGFIGMDMAKGDAVDLMADFNKAIPLKDSTVDEIRAHDFIEHINDKIYCMNEIWRVCKNKARVDIMVPSTDGRAAFQDPTHVSFWNEYSFQYFIYDEFAWNRFHQAYGIKCKFKKLRLETIPVGENKQPYVMVELEAIKP